MTDPLPPFFFTRQDESPDERFYAVPRLVNHIDDETIAAITAYYREVLPVDGTLLDLMSSWVSHLPPEMSFHRVVGLGMNPDELVANPRLDERLVHNLNQNPTLPFETDCFDAVMIVVSIQYLTRPFEVFREIERVLKPAGQCIVAMSHRLFPTKAIYAFQALQPADKFNLVRRYLGDAGLVDIDFVDRSPAQADPLWILRGEKSA